MKILIVDYEPLIHVSIEFSLKELGDDDLVISHAVSGSDMLQKMERDEPDIALVDIRMPGMDGLTAINTARKRWPKTRYYIMSGFSEFEYAREAIKLNVVDYLLKPLMPEQLAEIIDRVRKEKNQENTRILERFQAWMIGTLHRHDVNSMYIPGYYSSVVLFCYDSARDQERNRLPDEIAEKHSNAIEIPCWEGQLVLIFALDINSVKDILHSLPYKDYPVGVTCIISPISCDPAELAENMHRILDASPLRVFFGINRRFQLQQFSEASEKEISSAAEWIELRNCFFEKRYADFVAKSSLLIPSLSDLKPAQINHTAEFISALSGEKVPEPYDSRRIGSFLADLGDSLIHNEGGADRIDAVIEYIQDHFCEDISVTQLSGQFDLSPNYLSSLLKKKLGMSFVDYLTALRIAKAKELLTSSTLSVREIGESIGYYSQSYFTKIFIKKESCTPGEYRKRNSVS